MGHGWLNLLKKYVVIYLYSKKEGEKDSREVRRFRP